MDRLKVLFLCTGNSCRSQMAEGWLRHLGGDRYEAFSAGTAPKPVHPLAVRAMREVGVDISGQQSKSVAGFAGVPLDAVVTVCDRARESCPASAGHTATLHWSFDDPAQATGTEEERMQVFRRVRDEIASRVRDFAR